MKEKVEILTTIIVSLCTFLTFGTLNMTQNLTARFLHYVIYFTNFFCSRIRFLRIFSEEQNTSDREEDIWQQRTLRFGRKLRVDSRKPRYLKQKMGTQQFGPKTVKTSESTLVNVYYFPWNSTLFLENGKERITSLLFCYQIAIKHWVTQ